MQKSTFPVVLIVDNMTAAADALKPYADTPANPRYTIVLGFETGSQLVGMPADTMWSSIGLAETHPLYRDCRALFGMPVKLSDAVRYINDENAIDPRKLRIANA